MMQNIQDLGSQMHTLCTQLFPINRSLTGEGVRETLSRIKKIIPQLVLKEIPTGTKVFDWTVPKEWKIREAYIITPDGEKICDFSENNLHLVGYSISCKRKMSFEELQEHLHSLPDQPDAIPYVTSYYKPEWGFCLTHDERQSLPEGEYEVYIDAEHFDGFLTYGELIVEGESKKEIFLSTYVCHPSMANNELSGPAVTAFLARALLSSSKLRYTYRLLFIPETIGSISYLSMHIDHLKENVVAGFNVSCVGDNRDYSYLPSRKGDTLSDLVAQHVLKHTHPNFKRYSWRDRGSDERQYCAPGIDLPIASIMRTKYGEYPEYHTSLDDLKNVVTPAGLEGGFSALWRAIEALERNLYPKVTVLGEPQLGKRGLYPNLSIKGNYEDSRLMMDLLTYADGSLSVLEIAELLETPCWHLYPLIERLEEHHLIHQSDKSL